MGDAIDGRRIHGGGGGRGRVCWRAYGCFGG